ncbi:MAG TPA: ArsR family transcriptional regulator [Methanoregula sp.]|jgi:ArsR family transcriptional regulator|nr:ArsR family transcriptional regulator [Methanoregula sp.]
MYDAVEVSRLLDILGNRNRRRIIELLRQKPCFVTEISETLMLSPKAVIDHLQMMEREAILSCQMDDRRRKYYYLENDILIDINLKQSRGLTRILDNDHPENTQLKKTVTMLGRMIKAHDMILSNLEQVNHDIETKINDLARNHKDLFRSNLEIIVLIALTHESLTLQELEQVTELSQQDLGEILKRFEQKGLIGRIKDRYTLRGIHAE